MPKVEITTDDKTIEVKDDYPMIDMCEEHDTSILFGCRDGACGACMIKVIEGAEHLSPMKDDERDFRIGADILRDMGFQQIRLLTNNPRKVEMLTRCNLDVVERVPLKVGKGRFNADYLATKAAKSGHLL